MLEGKGVFRHPVHVHPPLVGKGAAPHIGHIGGKHQVGHLGDVPGGFPQAHQLVLRDAAVALFHLEIGDDGGKVGVAAPLPKADVGPLDLGRRRRDRIQGLAANHAFDVVRRYLQGLPVERL